MLRQLASGCCFAGAALASLLGLLVRSGPLEVSAAGRTFLATSNHFWTIAILLFLAGAVLAALRARSG